MWHGYVAHSDHLSRYQYRADDLGREGCKSQRDGESRALDGADILYRTDRIDYLLARSPEDQYPAGGVGITASGVQEQEMAGLRKSAARQAAVCFGVIILCLVGALADSFRAPEKQITASLYATGVHGYCLAIRPVVHKWVRCRFWPTCSEYSIQAVKRHGIRKGLWLTIDRLYRCRASVRRGTFDPVPPMDVHSQ